ncbi:hypothetical protein G210_0233, partial [Candida maltosa Xu316]
KNGKWRLKKIKVNVMELDGDGDDDDVDDKLFSKRQKK